MKKNLFFFHFMPVAVFIVNLENVMFCSAEEAF